MRDRRNAVVVYSEALSGRERRELKVAARDISRSSSAEVAAPAGLPRPATNRTTGTGVENLEYWDSTRVTQPPHHSTSSQIAGAIPWLAESGIGSEGPLLGIDLGADTFWRFSPWSLYRDSSTKGAFSTNVLVLGAYRAGKSGTIKMLVLRSLAFGHQAIVPSDSKGEWAELARRVGGQVVTPGAGTMLNPLDRGPSEGAADDPDASRRVRDRRLTTLVALVDAVLSSSDRRIDPMEHATLSAALDHSVAESGRVPTLRSVRDALIAIRGRQARHSMRMRFVLDRFITGDLQGLFEGESTIELDPDAPVVAVDTSHLFARSELAAQVAQICTSSWIQAVIADRAAGRQRYLIREEGWRDMTTLSSLRTLQQWLKLSRHYGVANILILHKVTDVDAVGHDGSEERALAYSIIGDIENKFVFRQNAQEVENMTRRLRLPASLARHSLALDKGCFLAAVGTRHYIVDAFATSTALERRLFDTDQAMTEREPHE